APGQRRSPRRVYAPLLARAQSRGRLRGAVRQPCHRDRGQKRTRARGTSRHCRLRRGLRPEPYVAGGRRRHRRGGVPDATGVALGEGRPMTGEIRRYEPIAISDESTVVAEFVSDVVRETGYQSEADLERRLIAQLELQAYDHLRIASEADLIANLRHRLEALNKVTFSDTEWDRFYTHKLAGANEGIVEKTARIQEDHVQILDRDDGSFANIRLIDKADIHNNTLQVLNQYESEGRRSTRYDVTILVNGLPLVHIELKRRGVDIREAFN